MYKIVLGMSYYIHPGGLGALVDGLRPDSKEVARSAVNVLAMAYGDAHGHKSRRLASIFY